jgi:hypothetical protein
MLVVDTRHTGAAAVVLLQVYRSSLLYRGDVAVVAAVVGWRWAKEVAVASSMMMKMMMMSMAA